MHGFITYFFESYYIFLLMFKTLELVILEGGRGEFSGSAIIIVYFNNWYIYISQLHVYRLFPLTIYGGRLYGLLNFRIYFI